MKKGGTTGIVIAVLVIGILGAVLLYSGGSSPTGAAPVGRTLICHATGSQTNPFVLISVPDDALSAHVPHGDLVACFNNADCANLGNEQTECTCESLLAPGTSGGRGCCECRPKTTTTTTTTSSSTTSSTVPPSSTTTGTQPPSSTTTGTQPPSSTTTGTQPPSTTSTT